MPGFQGGLSLDALTQLLAQQNQAGLEIGPGSAGDLLSAITGTLALPGGFAAQSFGAGGQLQSAPQQNLTGGYTAGQTQEATTDPMAIIRQALGLTSKGLGIAKSAFGSGGGDPTEVSSNESAAYGTGVAPTDSTPPTDAALGELGINTDLTSLMRAFGFTPSPNTVSAYQSMPPAQQQLFDAWTGPGVMGGTPSSGYTPGVSPTPMGFTNTLGSPQTSEQAGIQTLLEAGFTPDQMMELFGGAEQSLTGGALPDLSTPLGGANQELLGISQQPLSNLGALPQTNWLGAAQGGIGGSLGLLNVLQGIEGGNIAQGIGGGLQAIGGGASLLKNLPGLSGALGIGGDALGAIGAGVGGLGSLLGLAQGIQSGNPVQIASGLYSLLPAINALGGTAAGAAALSSLGLGTLPVAATATTAATAGSGVLGAVAPVLAAASVYALPAAAVIFMITETIAEFERKRIMDAGFTNNPIKGALYSASTEGVANAQKILDTVMRGGDLSKVGTLELGQALTAGINNLIPYFTTAQGGRGAIRASDTLTGGQGSSASEPLPGGDVGAYTQNFTNAQTGLVGLVNELLSRGVTYEQLGQLPVSGNWTQQTLDAGNRPDEMMARAIALRPELGTEGSALFGRLGLQNYDPYRGAFGSDTSWQSDYGPNGLNSPEGQRNMVLQQALGASMLGPADVTKASGLMTDMYGGPLWTAMARMGAGGPEIQNMIAQNFDPWVNARAPQFAQTRTGQRYSESDIANYEAQHGFGSAAAAGLTAGGLVNPLSAPAAQSAPNYWQQLMQQPPQGAGTPPPQLGVSPGTASPLAGAMPGADLTGLMAMLQGGLPDFAQDARPSDPRVLLEDELRRRMMFQQYGFA